MTRSPSYSRFDRRRVRSQAAMLRLLAGAFLAALVTLLLIASDFARAAEPLVRFDGGIGSQPFAKANGVVVDNSVPTANPAAPINPGGRPWVIERLSADVSSDGQVRVDGRGLLLAGGAAVGTTGNQSVRAVLLCAGIVHSSELVKLDERGDFRISGFLNPIPPSPCNNATLLIVNANGAWFAAGIPRR
jgi:hypothetical protein